MQLSTLENSPQIRQNKLLADTYSIYEKLLATLRNRTLPEEVTNAINRNIEQANAFMGTDKELLNHLKKSKTFVLRLIEKKLKLVPKKHYQKRWLAVGLATFGIPLGFAFALAFHNMAFLGMGFPIGMCIGVAVGAGLDKKASDSGDQLNFES